MGAGSIVNVNSGLNTGGVISAGVGSGLGGKRFVREIGGVVATSISKTPSRDSTGRTFSFVWGLISSGLVVGGGERKGKGVPSTPVSRAVLLLLSGLHNIVLRRRIRRCGTFRCRPRGRWRLGDHPSLSPPSSPSSSNASRSDRGRSGSGRGGKRNCRTERANRSRKGVCSRPIVRVGGRTVAR